MPQPPPPLLPLQPAASSLRMIAGQHLRPTLALHCPGIISWYFAWAGVVRLCLSGAHKLRRRPHTRKLEGAPHNNKNTQGVADELSYFTSPPFFQSIVLSSRSHAGDASSSAAVAAAERAPIRCIVNARFPAHAWFERTRASSRGAFRAFRLSVLRRCKARPRVELGGRSLRGERLLPASLLASRVLLQRATRRLLGGRFASALVISPGAFLSSSTPPFLRFAASRQFSLGPAPHHVAVALRTPPSRRSSPARAICPRGTPNAALYDGDACGRRLPLRVWLRRHAIGHWRWRRSWKQWWHNNCNGRQW